jgi:hypothetical protein
VRNPALARVRRSFQIEENKMDSSPFPKSSNQIKFGSN